MWKKYKKHVSKVPSTKVRTRDPHVGTHGRHVTASRRVSVVFIYHNCSEIKSYHSVSRRMDDTSLTTATNLFRWKMLDVAVAFDWRQYPLKILYFCIGSETSHNS